MFLGFRVINDSSFRWCTLFVQSIACSAVGLCRTVSQQAKHLFIHHTITCSLNLHKLIGLQQLCRFVNAKSNKPDMTLGVIVYGLYPCLLVISLYFC